MKAMAKLDHYYQPTEPERVSIDGVEISRCGWKGGLYNELDCRYPFRPELHMKRCPVVVEYKEDDDMPNEWHCEEVVSTKFPHCNVCQNHHAIGADCHEVALMMEADEELKRWAR